MGALVWIGAILIVAALINAWTGVLQLASVGDHGTTINLPGGGNLSIYDIGMIILGFVLIIVGHSRD